MYKSRFKQYIQKERYIHEKTIAVIATIALLLSFAIPTIATDVKKLSEMSENECIDFLKQHNIEIPDDYTDEKWAPFVKEIIRIVEEDPEYEFAFNYTVTLEFANAIKGAVNDYYGTTLKSKSVQRASSYTTLDGNYVLQDSTAVGAWMTIYNDYNCYVYSIETPEFVYKNPGYWSGQLFNLSMTIDEIADLAIDDLKALSHERVFSSSTMDISNLCTNEKIICVRRGTYDYHFMKYDSEEWYHKPATSAILKYNYTPSVMRTWSNERMLSSGAVEPTIYYDSVIIYISYDGHDWGYTYNGDGTHTKSCSICGDVITISCNNDYTYLGNDKHSATCVDCGNTATGVSCTIVTTYNDNGTHTISCNACSNSQTESCDLEYTNITNTRHSVACRVCDYYKNSQTCTPTYTSNGDKETHTARCTLCKNSYIGDCSVAFAYVGSEEHSGSCNKCSQSIKEACYKEYTYCGNSANGDVHTQKCQTCGHDYGNGMLSCTFAWKSVGNNTHVNACTECQYIKSGPSACMFNSNDICRFCGGRKDAAILNEQEEDIIGG